MQLLPPSSNSSTKVRRIALTVAYDGTDFQGWASQPDCRTVHGTLTSIVRQVTGEEAELFGASRTDSGAHALGQVVHADLEWIAPLEKIPRILNNLLPDDLSVISAKEVGPGFNARFSAIDRHYRYRIRQTPRNPLRSKYVHDSWRPLDLEKMQHAAKGLVGSHDFWAYSEEVPDYANTVREIFSFNVRRVGREVWIDVVGNAFMRGMMRRMAGALFEVGKGKRPVSDIPLLLHEKHRYEIQRPVVLPAKGLCLHRVRYGRHPQDSRERYVNQDLPGDWEL